MKTLRQKGYRSYPTLHSQHLIEPELKHKCYYYNSTHSSKMKYYSQCEWETKEQKLVFNYTDVDNSNEK